MAGLVKATLALASDKGAKDAIEVQLNPTSLRLEQANQVDGGSTRGRQVEQFPGMSYAKVSMELVFDTADEGTTDQPRNVREKTRQIARFVIPVKGGAKPAPPRVLFSWGPFVLEGVMTSMSEDIDLFASDGTPLRAKVNISISVQDPKFAELKSGPGSFTANQATAPGASAPGGPGTSGAPNPDRTALALGGESAAEFSARVGLDPSNWRALSGSVGNSLSLQAGAQIDFAADASVGGGIGAGVGLEAGVSASAQAALGLAGSATSATSATAAGFALAAAGGVAAAAAGAATARASAAAGDARHAFSAAIPAVAGAASGGTAGAVAAGAGTASAGAAATSGAGGAASGSALPIASTSSRLKAGPVATVVPASDRRAISFGFGVPLRPLVGLAAAERRALVQGSPRLSGRGAGQGTSTTSDPTVPPWVVLPALDRARQVADQAQAMRRPSCCGCGGATRGGSPGGVAVGAAAGGFTCGTCGGMR
jgi:hypothetical protein